MRRTQIALTGRPGGPAGPKGPVPPGIPYDKMRDMSDMRIVFVLGITFQNECEMSVNIFVRLGTKLDLSA